MYNSFWRHFFNNAVNGRGRAYTQLFFVANSIHCHINADRNPIKSMGFGPLYPSYIHSPWVGWGKQKPCYRHRRMGRAYGETHQPFDLITIFDREPTKNLALFRCGAAFKYRWVSVPSTHRFYAPCKTCISTILGGHPTASKSSQAMS